MAVPVIGLFGNIWASDRTSFDGGAANRNPFVTEPSPFELEIQRRIVEVQQQLQRAQLGRPRDPLDEALDDYGRRGMTIEYIQNVLMGRSLGGAFKKPAPKPDPPMPKLVELRPKRQIQIED